MRAFLNVLLLVLATAGAGYACCRLAGFDPHGRWMMLAGGACLMASAAGLTPLLLTRGAGAGAVTQAGLVGSVLHMLAALACGGAIYMMLQLGQPFLYWLLAFYLATLLGVSAASVKAIKLAVANDAAAKR